MLASQPIEISTILPNFTQLNQFVKSEHVIKGQLLKDILRDSVADNALQKETK